MTENKRFGFEMDKNCYKCIVDTRDKKLYTDKKQVVDLLNDLSDENEQLKQNIGIILKYCREKGKYAMDTKEIEAHNVLQRIVNKVYLNDRK